MHSYGTRSVLTDAYISEVKSTLSHDYSTKFCKTHIHKYIPQLIDVTNQKHVMLHIARVGLQINRSTISIMIRHSTSHVEHRFRVFNVSADRGGVSMGEECYSISNSHEAMYAAMEMQTINNGNKISM